MTSSHVILWVDQSCYGYISTTTTDSVDSETRIRFFSQKFHGKSQKWILKIPLGSFVASISLKEILLGVTSGSNLPELVNRWTLGPQAIVQWSLAASWLPPRTGKVGSDSKFKLIQPKITPKKTSESQRSDFISFYLISNISFPYFLLKSMMFKPLPTLPATCVPVPERVSLSSGWQLHTKKHPVLIHHWPSVRTKITATLQGTI